MKKSNILLLLLIILFYKFAIFSETMEKELDKTSGEIDFKKNLLGDWEVYNKKETTYRWTRNNYWIKRRISIEMNRIKVLNVEENFGVDSFYHHDYFYKDCNFKDPPKIRNLRFWKYRILSRGAFIESDISDIESTENLFKRKIQVFYFSCEEKSYEKNQPFEKIIYFKDSKQIAFEGQGKEFIFIQKLNK